MPNLEQRVERIEESMRAIDRQLRRLFAGLVIMSRSDPPVGTVIAFAGNWPPAGTAPSGEPWSEELLGWIRCDNRLLEGEPYAELREVMGSDRAPDYQGYFLRCIDESGESRDPDGRRQPGQIQTDALKLHGHKLVDPGHQHRFVSGVHTENNGTFGTERYPWISSEFMPSTDNERTGITIDDEGGAETRPKNAAVHFIVKFRSFRSFRFIGDQFD